jgi:hypothetical protein
VSRLDLKVKELRRALSLTHGDMLLSLEINQKGSQSFWCQMLQKIAMSLKKQ